MDSLEHAKVTKPMALIGVVAALSAFYVLSKIVYILALDPLRHIPGPKINAISRLPYIRHLLGGTTQQNVQVLHEKYGDVVRLTPNEVSFSNGEEAWPEIYGFRTGKMKGHLTMQKDPVWYPRPVNGIPSILLADDETHSRGRRTLSHAFSDKALMEQEPLIQNYVDQLVMRLKEVTSASSDAVDMTKWYNWTTFDVIADLMFGEPFFCLQELKTHRYIELIFGSLKGAAFLYVMTYYPWFKRVVGPFMGFAQVMEKRKEFFDWIHNQVTKRRNQETQRPDFMTHILRHNGSDKDATISDGEMDSNAFLIIVAGSETTATLLSGVTYLLLKNPEVYQKLKDDVRGRYKSYDEITIDAVNNDPYLIAVLAEGLRYFPPVPAGFERRVPHGGETVTGYYLPEGTSVSIDQWPTYHLERNFKDPDAFVPERWMGDPKYANDKRAAHQPFSFGPRNCLGKNLAYAEMRLILAKIVWSFDMELEPRSTNWINDCKVWTLWAKPELAVRVKEVVRS